MLLFRSLTLGLLGACFLLIATRPTFGVRRDCTLQVPTLAMTQRPPVAASANFAADRAFIFGARADGAAIAALPDGEGARPMALPPAVVDVAPGVSASRLASLVRLDEGEHVTTIDDQAVSGDIDAGVRLAALDLRARRYIDLGVEGPRGARRVLVLLH
ncbi:MAG: hypothetical protein HOV81_08790 [Kofleriaceae bacterium]|nr:hypothetical protein [Kofleriaceae bacterium]